MLKSELKKINASSRTRKNRSALASCRQKKARAVLPKHSIYTSGASRNIRLKTRMIDIEIDYILYIITRSAQIASETLL